MRGLRQPRKAQLFGVTLLMVVLLALAPAPASAAHSNGATYTGTFATGGSIAFDVSADGNSITRIKVTDAPTECGTLTAELTGNVPIQNEGFSQTIPPPEFSGTFVKFSGTFTAPQNAQGTLQYQQAFPPCTSSQLSWSATTTTPTTTTPTTATPITTTPITTTPPAGPEKIPPVVVLLGKTTQQTAGVSVTVSCINEACLTNAIGTVSVPGSGLYTLTPAVARIGKGAKAQLKLKIPAKAQQAIKKAQGKRKVIKASITVTARDAAGNKTVKTRTIRLI